MDDFFSNLDPRIIEMLSRHPILQSAAGRLQLPIQLIYVPKKFHDTANNPFTLCASTEAQYLSSLYDHEDFHVIFQRIGVSEMKSADFLAHLGLFVQAHPVGFQKKPYKWHSDLAAVLSGLAKESNSVMATLSELDIVPLKDGRWVSANSGHLLFARKPDQYPLPKGLDVFELRCEVEDDPQRKEFLEIMGAKPFTADRICKRIADVHANWAPPSASSAKDAICHVLFAFNVRGEYQSERKLWFVAEDGTLALGEDVYVRCAAGIQQNAMPPEFDIAVMYLHQDYFATMAPESHQAFTEWVAETQSVNRVPRLVTPATCSPFSISTEFKVLLKFWSGLQVLSLMKSHWEYYSTWVGDSPDKEPAEPGTTQNVSFSAPSRTCKWSASTEGNSR